MEQIRVGPSLFCPNWSLCLGKSLIFQKADALGWLVRSHVTIQSNGKRYMQAVMNQEQMVAQAVVSLLVPAKFSSVSDPSST